MSKRIRFAVFGTLIFLSVAYLVFSGTRDSMVYYLTVSELKLKGDSVQNEKVRITGSVVDGSIEKLGVSSVNLGLTDGKEFVNIVYTGDIPSGLTDNAELVIEGKLEKDGSFRGELMLTKCPSKYKTGERPQQAEWGENSDLGR